MTKHHVDKGKNISTKKCTVCGFENLNTAIQCRKCASLFIRRSFLSKIRIFKRLNDLEDKSRKYSATLMKIIKENKP